LLRCFHQIIPASLKLNNLADHRRLTDNDMIEQVDVQKAAPSAPEESLQTMPTADS
jgi:hypothetical protein